MSAQDLISKAAVQTDRTGWARRGHVEFNGNQVLALEVVNDDLTAAAQKLDEWAVALGGPVVEVQHVYRRSKRVIYGRVQP